MHAPTVLAHPLLDGRSAVLTRDLEQTTRGLNTLKSLNARCRRAIQARGHFPTEQVALKSLSLVTRSLDPTGQATPLWTMR